MKITVVAFALGCLAVTPFPTFAAEPLQEARKPTKLSLPIEQPLFNDFAARIQEHLQNTAALLEQIRLSEDPQERPKLMKEYAKAMQTTLKVTHTMLALSGPVASMDEQKKGKDMMGGSMGCGMMKQRAGAQSAATDHEAQEKTEAQLESEAEGESSAGNSGHEGHH